MGGMGVDEQEAERIAWHLDRITMRLGPGATTEEVVRAAIEAGVIVAGPAVAEGIQETE
jgi:hypothetical protein